MKKNNIPVRLLKFFFFAAFLAACTLSFAIDWPLVQSSETPVSANLVYEAEKLDLESHSLSEEPALFKLSSELPAVFLNAWVFDHGRGIAGILLASEPAEHRLVDTLDKRFISHSLVLPDRQDTTPPRVADVWVNQPLRTSIVTWRNNQVYSSISSVGIELYDDAAQGEGEIASGIYYLELAYAGQAVATYTLGGLAEDGDANLIIDGLEQASARVIDRFNSRRQHIGYALSLEVPIVLPPGRGLLQLLARDAYGNETRLQFVLVVSTPELP